jgi:hypothetical protein
MASFAFADAFLTDVLGARMSAPPAWTIANKLIGVMLGLAPTMNPVGGWEP